MTNETPASGRDLDARARAWLADDPDPDTRAELAGLLDRGEHAAVADRFTGALTFGTAGLRGELGAGPARMNRAVVRRSTAGLAAVVGRTHPGGTVVVGHDARHKSAEFARDTAAVLAGAGLRALLLAGPVPTPVLAFAVREFAAAAGVMVTASHNPPRDNGYKVYLGEPAGAQIAPPLDARVEEAIAAAGPLPQIALSQDYGVLGADVVRRYLGAVEAAVPRLAGDAARAGLRVAYTPLHGVGAAAVREALRRRGFADPDIVAEQAEPDPDFPTVAFPNPEEPGAMDLALALGAERGADLVLANDPDADRCAVAVGGRLLRGDEVGVLLADALCEAGVGGTFATTVVSSTLLRALCAARGRRYAETLTGFKWIMRAAGDLGYGYEEALGYAVAPDVVRDKDGISAALLVAELAAAAKAAGQTLLDRLDALAAEFGVHATDQYSVRVTDTGTIAAAMATLRSRPPDRLLGRAVTEVADRLPEADVLTLRAPGCRVVCRPSGTEAKLKAYLEVVVPVPGRGAVAAARAAAAGHLRALRGEVAAALGL